MGTLLVTGHAKGGNSQEVAKAALEQAQLKLGNKKVDLAIVYCSSEYNYQEVVSTIRKLTNNAPLIGCSTGGEFTEDSVKKGSIALGLISSDNMKFFTAISSGLKEDELATIEQLKAKLPTEVAGYPELSGIMLIDGLAGKGEEVVVNTSMVFDFGIKLIGGAAADDLKFDKTYVFCNDEVINNAVCLCMIASKTPIFTAVQHGHIPLSKDLKVTKAVGSVLYEVNNRPAWDVWVEVCAEHAKTLGINVNELTEASDIGSFLIRYELGIKMDDDEDNFKVRVPLSKNEDGSLNFACTIPEGITFNVMRSAEINQIESAKTAISNAKQKAGNTKLAGALVFDCVCRGIICGNNFDKTIDEYKKVIGDIPLLGWETYGEICIDPGDFSGFHNTTSVIMLLPA